MNINRPAIGIRPIIDARRLGIRDALEDKCAEMAKAAKELIEKECFYADGTPARVVVYSGGSIACGEEAARCDAEFASQDVIATLSVTPSWCYPLETIDINPAFIKAIWGFNGTERPGAVYLAAALSACDQMGVPTFSIYGRETQDITDHTIPADVAEKIVRFAQASIAVGQMKGRSYVSVGGVSMGIMGSFLDPSFFMKYLGMRPEWLDMTEILRRMKLHIYCDEEYQEVLGWIKENCPEGWDKNRKDLIHSPEQKVLDWEFVAKLTVILKDVMQGNDKLQELGWDEEAFGKNALFAGFQGQREWSDWNPNCDFTESIFNSTFDWRGKKMPTVLATENDSLNGTAMLFANLLTGTAPGFADVRCYWDPKAVERVSGWKPEGTAANGFIHLINSGACCLDACGESVDATGAHVMKRWWEMNEEDIRACLKAADWCPASLTEFRGGGFSSHFMTAHEMPITMLRVNLVDGVGPTLQIAEGTSCVLPDEVHKVIDARTDPTWPTTYFVPNTTGHGAFRDVYSVMDNWGANHGAFCYGHIGADLITLASMLRIPVTMHNVAEENLFRPHAWSAFATSDPEQADARACAHYGPRYRQ